MTVKHLVRYRVWKQWNFESKKPYCVVEFKTWKKMKPVVCFSLSPLVMAPSHTVSAGRKTLTSRMEEPTLGGMLNMHRWCLQHDDLNDVMFALQISYPWSSSSGKRPCIIWNYELHHWYYVDGKVLRYDYEKVLWRKATVNYNSFPILLDVDYFVWLHVKISKLQYCMHQSIHSSKPLFTSIPEISEYVYTRTYAQIMFQQTCLSDSTYILLQNINQFQPTRRPRFHHHPHQHNRGRKAVIDQGLWFLKDEISIEEF